LHKLKNAGSEIGSLRYDLSRLALRPLGGSLVILTPFCSTDTGNAGEGRKKKTNIYMYMQLKEPIILLLNNRVF
jgi:hypothetical protein